MGADQYHAPAGSQPFEAEAAFARYFAAWAITIPHAARLDRSDGSLVARGWTVRWRWHDDGSLEFRASHRMTNERWVTILPDGSEISHAVPSEFRVVRPGEDAQSAEAAYAQEWRAHGEAVSRAGLRFADLPGELRPLNDDHVAWQLDEQLWQLSPLSPRLR